MLAYPAACTWLRAHALPSPPRDFALQSSSSLASASGRSWPRPPRSPMRCLWRPRRYTQLVGWYGGMAASLRGDAAQGCRAGTGRVALDPAFKTLCIVLPSHSRRRSPTACWMSSCRARRRASLLCSAVLLLPAGVRAPPSCPVLTALFSFRLFSVPEDLSRDQAAARRLRARGRRRGAGGLRGRRVGGEDRPPLRPRLRCLPPLAAGERRCPSFIMSLPASSPCAAGQRARRLARVCGLPHVPAQRELLLLLLSFLLFTRALMAVRAELGDPASRRDPLTHTPPLPTPCRARPPPAPACRSPRAAPT